MRKTVYRNTGIPAKQLRQIRDYLNTSNSISLGGDWGHKKWWYKLYYPTEVVKCKAFDDDVLKTIREKGETTRHETFFESRTGRKLHLNTTDPTQITLEIENGKHTDSMRERVEAIMSLLTHVRRVFITHGHNPAWHDIQSFIQNECQPKLPTLELAHEPSKGRTLIEKLDEESQSCSYAVVVMTGDDVVEDEPRARENVMHEIGFFQGRYGRSRVCLVHEEGVSIPSNLEGIGRCSFPKDRVAAALIELQREIQAAFPEEKVG